MSPPQAATFWPCSCLIAPESSKEATPPPNRSSFSKSWSQKTPEGQPRAESAPNESNYPLSSGTYWHMLGPRPSRARAFLARNLIAPPNCTRLPSSRKFQVVIYTEKNSVWNWPWWNGPPETDGSVGCFVPVYMLLGVWVVVGPVQKCINFVRLLPSFAYLHNCPVFVFLLVLIVGASQLASVTTAAQ